MPIRVFLKEMKHYWVLALTTLGMLFVSSSRPSTVEAALIHINQDGNITWNVLSFQTDNPKESLKIVNIANKNPINQPVISLINQDGKVQLQVTSDSGNTTTDITDFTDEIIEIEEKEAAKRLKITSVGNEFVIKQDDVSVATSFPIKVDPKNKVLSVQTQTGERYIKMLPSEVFGNAVKADFIDRLINDQSISLTEGDNGELEYQIKGQKNLSLLNLIKLDAPVNLAVSATTGEVLKIDQPTWLRILGFLFT